MLLAVGGGIAVALVVALLVLLGPGARHIVAAHHPAPERILEGLNETRTLIVTAFGVIGLLVGGIGTVGTLLYSAQSIDVTRRTIEVSRDGQVTDRYTAAVSQLADPSIDARVGGVYALQRVMRDSPADQPTVIQVLTAFVRQHAKREHPDTAPPADIENAVRVIADRDPQFDKYILDLDGAYLEHVKTSGSDFRRADLSGAHFGGAEMDGMALQGADLGNADLSGANLRGTHLENAVLNDEADLSGATLDGAVLRGADLRSAILTGPETKLDGTDFTGANLEGADLRGADLRRAKGLTKKQISSAVTNDKTLR